MITRENYAILTCLGGWLPRLGSLNDSKQRVSTRRCPIYGREYSEHAKKLTQDSGSCKPVVPVAYASDSIARCTLLSGNNGYECSASPPENFERFYSTALRSLTRIFPTYALSFLSVPLIMQNSNQGAGEGAAVPSVLACLYFDEKLSRELQVFLLLKPFKREFAMFVISRVEIFIFVLFESITACA